MTDLLTRIRHLEATVASLRQQIQAGSEQLIPNYLTISPGGQVGADFTGRVQASELDLIAGSPGSPIRWLNSQGGLVAQLSSDGAGNLTFSPGVLSAPKIQGAQIGGATITTSELVLPEAASGSPEPINQLAWTTDGSPNSPVVTNIYTYQISAGAPNLIAQALGQASGDVSMITLQAVDNNGNQTLLLVKRDPQTSSDSWVQAQATSGGAATSTTNVTIIDGAGQSSFLQLGPNITPRKLYTTWGHASVTFPGGTYYTSTTVNYNLGGNTAGTIQITPNTGGQWTCYVSNVTSSSFNVTISTTYGAPNPAAGTTVSFYWFVAG
jgi:hypothetical protein